MWLETRDAHDPQWSHSDAEAVYVAASILGMVALVIFGAGLCVGAVML